MAKRTSRGDIIRKVKGLSALADDDGGNEHQREAARRKIVALRLKHGIGDDEMTSIEGEEITFMGMRFMFYGQRIAPLVDRIRHAVADAISLIGDDTTDAVDLLEHVRKDLKVQVELVEKARNEFVKKRYREKRAELYPTWDDETDGPHAHNMTVKWIKGDLRKDMVERIVGVSDESIMKKHWAWIEAQESADA